MFHQMKIEERFFDPTNPAFGREHRAVCACGFAGPWRIMADQAVMDRVAHERA